MSNVQPPQNRTDPVDLINNSIDFFPDSTMVIVGTQALPLDYYTLMLQKDYQRHYMNYQTATCHFVIKNYTQQTLPAHKPYFAARSIYFRTIFDRHDLVSKTVELELPHPDVFLGIYKYLYDGDEDAWLNNWFTNTEQVRQSWELIRFLELVKIPEKVLYRVRLELEAVRLT